jgi:hypothetical protein
MCGTLILKCDGMNFRTMHLLSVRIVQKITRLFLPGLTHERSKCNARSVVASQFPNTQAALEKKLKIKKSQATF